MHCPQCLTEYRDGFVQCADCRVPLKSGPPPEESAGGFSGENHEVDLVTVLETDSAFALKMATAALEDAGIDYVLNGNAAHFYTPGLPPIPTGIFGALDKSRLPMRLSPYAIQVARESQKAAEEVVERFKEMEEE